MTADATTARYGMGVVFLNTWQTREENRDTKEKEKENLSALPLCEVTTQPPHPHHGVLPYGRPCSSQASCTR